MAKQQKIMVVKYGSSSVTNDKGMDQTRVKGYVRQLARLYDQYALIVVSSGSIVGGKTIWDTMRPGQDYPGEQPLAMLGSAGAFMAWQKAFAQHSIPAGQLLVSHREIDDSQEGPMLKHVLMHNIAAGIVTVANENDAVSDIEIKQKSYGGDNDGLASFIAGFVGAQHLVLMTDTRGLFDKRGRLVRRVTSANLSQAYLMAGGPSAKGRGGMYQKLQAAHRAAYNGIQAYIGHADDAIEDIISKKIGTFVER